MKYCFLTLSFLISFSLLAQDSTSVSKKQRKPLLKPIKDYAGDSIVPAGRNEIAINMAPFFNAALGAYPGNEVRYSLFYKRGLKKEQAFLRAGIMFKPQVLTSYDLLTSHWYFNQMDSTRSDNIFMISSKKPIQLNLGFEWRSKGIRRWTTYFSFDIIGGAYNQDYYLAEVQQKLDSTGNWVIDPATFTSGNSFTVKQKGHNWYVGGSPNLGLKYAFNKRWVMSVQTGIEFTYVSNQVYTRNSLGTDLVYGSYSSFNIDSPGLFNEFALTYRF